MKKLLLILGLVAITAIGWGQQILIKEDFEFLWPVQQYNIEGDWWLEYGYNSNLPASLSRAFKGNAYMSFNNLQQYDSVYVEFTLISNGSVYNPNYLEISSDSLSWENGVETGIFNGVWSSSTIINTNEYPYIRINSSSIIYLDNLLVIGYSDVEISNCQYDSNQDGSINAPDLIDFLSWYGTTTVCE